MNTRRTIQLALVGCGEHAETGHAIPLARYKSEHPDEIALVAACDIRIERAQKFCERYGFKAAYGSIDELLSREEVDGCIAVVPPERISETGILLLNRHVPCVVEKPRFRLRRSGSAREKCRRKWHSEYGFSESPFYAVSEPRSAVGTRYRFDSLCPLHDGAARTV